MTLAKKKRLRVIRLGERSPSSGEHRQRRSRTPGLHRRRCPSPAQIRHRYLQSAIHGGVPRRPQNVGRKTMKKVSFPSIITRRAAQMKKKQWKPYKLSAVANPPRIFPSSITLALIVLHAVYQLVVVETLLICERMLIIRLSVYGYTSSAFKFQKLVLVLFSFLCCLLVTFLVQLSLMDVEEEAVYEERYIEDQYEVLKASGGERRFQAELD
ncbi:LOW QUALITY PROTEIN: hypothetical protein HID58_057574 [Brassica napus]|uniref:Uncharacterized protein n=1 Tax=Brassica napus TaxID=3708 RepID=A0ABQ8ARJ3_BRANA|nr:LOW QUALITY PROTEIN: hypothetical protein HID58_057574 [Brassica napus]